MFDFAVGKRFHSDLCRKKWHSRQTTEARVAAWNNAAMIAVPDGLEAAPPPIVVRQLVEGFKAAGGFYFRLASPRLRANSNPIIHWFPARLKPTDPLGWTIDPWQQPEVPHPDHQGSR